MTPRLGCGLLSAIVCLLFAGCSQELKTYPVSGTVTWNGEDLKEGDVYFHSTDPAVSDDAGKIVNGRFQFRAKAGPKRVAIRFSQEIPGKTTPMGSLQKLEVIPERYNDRSELTATVSPDGKNEYEFKLEGTR